MSSQTTEHPETEGSFRGHEVLPIQALLFCFRAGGLATGIPQSCFLGQQILPQLFGQAQWHLLNVAASSAAVAATQSFSRGFPNSIPNGSKQLYSCSIGPALVPTFPRQPRTRGSAGSSGPAPEGAAELSHGGTERAGGGAAAGRSCAGAEPGASAVPLQEEVGENGGSSALVFFPSIRHSPRCSSPVAPPFAAPISSSLPPPPPPPSSVTAAPLPRYTHRGSRCTLLHPSPLYPKLPTSLSPPPFPLLHATPQLRLLGSRPLHPLDISLRRPPPPRASRPHAWRCTTSTPRTACSCRSSGRQCAPQCCASRSTAPCSTTSPVPTSPPSGWSCSAPPISSLKLPEGRGVGRRARV